MDKAITAIAAKILDGGEATAQDARALAAVEGRGIYDLLYWANRIRERFCGDRIHLCSIVNARSGACSEDCIFCSQSAMHSTDVPVHAMIDKDEIVSAGTDAASQGAHHFGIVTSGPGPGGDENLTSLCFAAQELTGQGEVSVCVSLGSLTPGQVAKLAAAGVKRIHHNVETSRAFFPKICTTHSYDDRIETVRAVKAAGLDICCGGILGLGEGWQDRIDLALELRELGVDSVPVNFLNPVAGTPCEKNEPIRAMDCLKIIALFRFILPDKTIKAAGGRERNLRSLQSWMFYAGANGTLIGNYLTTMGRPAEEDVLMIEDLGLSATRPFEGDHP